jgi:hypothetical protein
MNHPKREEWAPFLFGEATLTARRDLEEHVKNCSDCARELAAWQRTLGKLPLWKMPPVQACPNQWAAPLIKWGIAAAIVLGFGFGLGWLSASGDRFEARRATLEASVKSSLLRELHHQLTAEFQTAQAETFRQMTNQLRTEWIGLLTETMKISAAQTQHQLAEVIQDLNATRDEDHRSLTELLDKFQKQRTEDYLSLRNDLETVAAQTDEEFGKTRRSFFQLSANRLNHSSKLIKNIQMETP